MVDPVGAKPLASIPRPVVVADITASEATPRAAPVAQTEGVPASALGVAVQRFAATPPVDLDRVSRIRRAIETNQYPIVAETIADRLIAIRLNWRPHGPA